MQNKILEGLSDDLILSKGMSMYFTLKPFDRPYIQSYMPGSNVLPGDVVAFHPPGGEGAVIVHRIMKIDGEKVITQGDNNKCVDPWELTSDKILGKVPYALRGKRKITIYGGAPGLGWAFLVGLSRSIHDGLRWLLGPVYHRLIATRLVKRFVARFIKHRVFRINSSDYEIHLLLGNRIIGRYRSLQKKWCIHRRFEPLINTERFSSIFLEIETETCV